MSNGIVFVLGAGFTRAFVPQAPLLVDDYGALGLRQRFASFPYAKAVLDNALADGFGGRIDLERLLTRLSGMPYDTTEAHRELALLEIALRKSLVQRIENAKSSGVDRKTLEVFGRSVIAQGASIVTFNYDDVLDQALWEVHRATTAHMPSPYWHPDGGYGFFCRPSVTTVVDSAVFMDRPHALLLKLHGSINWYWRLGEGAGRGPAGLVHHEDWYSSTRDHSPARDRIKAHLEQDPFIVPPVLVKSELTAHPVLRVVWELAYQSLAQAKKVVFIGYSLPVTDLASRMLFRETLANRTDLDLRVVDFAADDKGDETRVKGVYRSLFKDLHDTQFEFAGAKAFIEREYCK